MKKVIFLMLMLPNFILGQSFDKIRNLVDSVMKVNDIPNKTKQNYLNIYNAKKSSNEFLEGMMELSIKHKTFSSEVIKEKEKELEDVKNKHYNEYINLFSEAINKFPDYILGYLTRGYYFFLKGDNQNALSDYSKLCAIADCNDEHYSAYSIIALTKFRLGLDYVDDYLKFIELRKKKEKDFKMDYDNFIYDRINDKIEEKKYSEVISIIGKLSTILPEYDTINVYKRANCYFAQKDYVEALKDYNYILSKGKNPSYIILDRKSTCEENLNLHSDAIVTYNTLITNYPKKMDSYFYRGIQYYKRSKYADALTDFLKYASTDSSLTITYQWTGTTLYYLNRYEEAIRDLNKALKVNANNSYLYLIRGKSYFKLKKYREAIIDADTAINTDKLNNFALDLYYLKNEAKCNLGLVEESIKDCDDEIQKKPSNPIHYFIRGKALSFAKRYEEAIKDFTKVFEFNDKDLQPFISRGKCYLALKMYKESLSDFENGLVNYPQDKEALEGKEKVLKILQEQKK